MSTPNSQLLFFHLSGLNIKVSRIVFLQLRLKHKMSINSPPTAPAAFPICFLDMRLLRESRRPIQTLHAAFTSVWAASASLQAPILSFYFVSPCWNADLFPHCERRQLWQKNTIQAKACICLLVQIRSSTQQRSTTFWVRSQSFWETWACSTTAWRANTCPPGSMVSEKEDTRNAKRRKKCKFIEAGRKGKGKEWVIPQNSPKIAKKLQEGRWIWITLICTVYDKSEWLMWEQKTKRKGT